MKVYDEDDDFIYTERGINSLSRERKNLVSLPKEATSPELFIVSLAFIEFERIEHGKYVLH